MIGAAQVNNFIVTANPFHPCMMAGDLRMIENHHIIGSASNRHNPGCAKLKRSDNGNGLLDRATPIIEGKGDECSMFIGDTEDVTTYQRFPKRCTTTKYLSIVAQPVRGRAFLWMWMHNDKLVALTQNLRVKP